jgi:hypothetical protein
MQELLFGHAKKSKYSCKERNFYFQDHFNPNIPAFIGILNHLIKGADVIFTCACPVNVSVEARSVRSHQVGQVVVGGNTRSTMEFFGMTLRMQK